MKNILCYILNKIRYCICLMLLIFIALPFVPVIIFTNWSWIGILYVANEEGCSLSKAKKLYLENKNRRYTDKSLNESCFYKINNSDSLSKVSSLHWQAGDSCNSYNMGLSSSTFYNHQTSPAYSHLSYNVYNNKF